MILILNLFKAFDISCVAHWAEGNTNYLIGRTILPNQRRGYKCLVYTESNAGHESASVNRNIRYKYDENGVNNDDFVELSKNSANNIQDSIQISISQDEFCRNIDNIIDDQYSFTFSKGIFRCCCFFCVKILFFIFFSFNFKIFQSNSKP